MKRRIVLTIDIQARDAAEANSQQNHLHWMIGGRAGIDLVDVQRRGNDYSLPIDPETGEVLESPQEGPSCSTPI